MLLQWGLDREHVTTVDGTRRFPVDSLKLWPATKPFLRLEANIYDCPALACDQQHTQIMRAPLLA